MDAETEDSANDMEIRSQDDDTSAYNSAYNSTVSSPTRFSYSENSSKTLTHEPNIQKDQEKDDYNAVLNSANDIDIHSQEDDMSAYNSAYNSTYSSPTRLSVTENTRKTPGFEPDIQKGNYDATLNSATDIEIRGQVEDVSNDNDTTSSSVHLSNIENLINNLTVEPMIQMGDQEKVDSVNDGTDIEAEVSSVPLSDSENVIKPFTGEPDAQKEDREIDNSVYDSTDIEVRGWEEAKFMDHGSFSPVRLSDSENMINALSGESDTHKENQEKGNTVSCTVNNQSDEKVELEPKDGEKIGEVLNDREGITVGSLSEDTGEMKTDPKDNTSSKKEERLVVYETQEPKLLVSNVAWPGKASVLTKFVKFKSLYSVSNIFRRISRKGDAQDDSNEIDLNKDVKSIEEEHESQEAKNEPKEVTLESLELKVIKGRIVLYTKLWCQSCKEARLFLRNKKLRYFEINIDVFPSRKRELEEITGSLDVPKVFFNEDLIGGLGELKALDESGQLDEKIEYVTSEWPSPKAPLPPFSGEDDVSSRGVVDELAIIVRKMKGSIIVKDRFYKFRRVTNCFLGSEAVDFLSEDQLLEREEAIEFGRKLAKELFFRHVLEENTFEDGNHPYRFLDQDPVISQCQNIPRELSNRLRFLLYAILDAYTSEDGKHIAYRTIHGSEEFARYLRIAEELQRLDLNKTPKEERLAFFINLYNLMAIHAILVWGHPEGALERRKLLNDFKYVIGGSAYSLSDIQNGILRANQRPPYTFTKPFAIADKRFKVSLPYSEPLIHFALVSGNRSDPALRCYSPKNIDMELMEAARNFVQSGALALDLDTMAVSVTKILQWYSVDFGRNDAEPQPYSGGSKALIRVDGQRICKSQRAVQRQKAQNREVLLEIKKEGELKEQELRMREYEQHFLVLKVDIGRTFDGHLRSCPSGLGGVVVQVTRRGDRIMAISIVIDGETVNVVSAYALQVGLSDAVKKSFWDALDELSGGHNTQIDYLLDRKGDLRACKDYRAFSSEACSSQHRLVTLDVLFERQRQRRARTERPRILWKNFNGDVAKTFRATVSEKLSTLREDLSASNTDQTWNTLARCIKDAAKDFIGVTRESSRTHSSHRESWWFSEEVQTKIAAKQARFRELLLCHEGNQEDRAMAKERYKVAKRESKIAMAQAKDKAYKDLYKKLDSKEGANDIYRIAKARERKRRDLGNIRINQEEVRAALQKMGRNKAVSPDQIPIESWRQRDLHIAFLDPKKAYDSVLYPRKKLYGTEFFPVEVGLHQGSSISPYLFALILDELSRRIQGNIPWSMVFVDDIMLVAKSANALNMRLESWRKALEDKGLRVSRDKTEYLRCDFDISGRIDEDVTHRIRTGWIRWRASSGVLCDKRVPLKLKGKFYRVAIRPVMLYGSECWPITKAQANRVEVAELRMLRWTCSKTMLDMIPNRVFRAELEVEPIIHKMREGRLRWFGHVKRRPQTAPVRRVETFFVNGLRRRGRPKLRWEDRLKQDMKELLLSEDITSDRNAWRDRISIGG
nr:DEP domain-containing protein [Tanacetum cinerariifolium]